MPPYDNCIDYRRHNFRVSPENKRALLSVSSPTTHLVPNPVIWGVSQYWGELSHALSKDQAMSSPYIHPQCIAQTLTTNH